VGVALFCCSGFAEPQVTNKCDVPRFFIFNDRMTNLKETLLQLLKKDERLFDDQGELKENLLRELIDNYDPQLLELLLNNETIRQKFFVTVGKTTVFKGNDFKFFIDENKLDNSYTQYENKIGLRLGSRLLREYRDVVLNFPYKDGVLEGGQSTEEGIDTYFEFDKTTGDYEEKKAKRKEIFFNQILAKDEIDRLFEPKAFKNILKYEKDETGKVTEAEVKTFKRDENGNIKDNLIIKGNNLLALHCLKEQFKEKVKLIYIDPPYYFNSEKKTDSFTYNSNFKLSTWLTFIKNRLEISKELLKNEGVIYVSISIDGYAYLKILMDEIFGKKNFIGDIIWQTATDNNPSRIKVEHEYVVVFALNKEVQPYWLNKSNSQEILIGKYYEIKNKLEENISEIEKELRIFIKANKEILNSVTHYDNVDNRGVFHDGDVANTKPGGYKYEIIHPKTGKKCKIPEYGFRFPESSMKEMLENDDILFGTDENTLIKPKIRLENVRDTLRSVIYEDGRKSTKELEDMFYRRVFTNPKSKEVLKRLFSFNLKKDDICLDFFSGSGTTAHAVLELNKEDGGNRQFILVEQMDYADTLTAKRVEKVIEKENISNSFIYLELAKNNQTALKKIEAAENFEELMNFFDEMYVRHFLNYNLKIREFKEKVSKEATFKNLPLERQKQIFGKMLDLNQLYVNRSDMEDSRYQLKDNDIAATNNFYGI
jgi:adenine-specific DNA-methyltransferase